MPTYEFRCPQGHEFEKFYRTISGAEAQAACPQCGEPAERVMSATRLRLQGLRLLSHGLRQERPSRQGDAGAGRSGASAAESAGSTNGEGRREKRRAGCGAAPAQRLVGRAEEAERIEAGGGQAGGGTGQEELHRVSAGADALRAELARAARALGAPADVVARARASARSRVRRLGDQPRDGARQAARPEAARPRPAAHRAHRHRARLGSRRRRSPARASSTSASAPTRSRSGLAALVAAGDDVRPLRRRRADEPVIVEFVSRQPHRPAARRPRPPGRARRRDLVAARVDGLERVARVLLQRRRRADREPRAEHAGARARARRRERSQIPEGGYHGEYIARDRRSATSPSIPTDRRGRRPRRDAPLRGAGAAQGAGPRPAGVRREVRHVLSSSRRSTPTARSRRR